MFDRPRDIGRGEDDPVFDADNPEWTAEDFGRALSGDQMPEPVRRAFSGQSRAVPVSDPPVEISLAISPHVLAHFQAQGADWRERMNAVLLEAMLAELRQR